MGEKTDPSFYHLLSGACRERWGVPEPLLREMSPAAVRSPPVPSGRREPCAGDGSRGQQMSCHEPLLPAAAGQLLPLRLPAVPHPPLPEASTTRPGSFPVRSWIADRHLHAVSHVPAPRASATAGRPWRSALAASAPSIASSERCALAPALEAPSHHPSLSYGLLSTQETTRTSILHANTPQTLGSCSGGRRMLWCPTGG